VELFAIFFIAGTIIGVVGGLARLWICFRGQSGREVAVAFFSTVFSKKIYHILKGLVSGVLFKSKLRSQDRPSGIFKALFILCYLAIIIAYHIKADSMPQLESLHPSLLFFYAAFADFYFLRDISITNFVLTDAIYGVLNDLFVAIIIAFDVFIIYRRFVRKAVSVKPHVQDFFSDAIVILWFVFRLAAETVTILAFDVHPSIAQYWFVAYGVSLAVKPLDVQWITLYHVLWPLSGLFIGVLVASIPLTKLWHLLVAPLTIIRRYSMRRGPGIVYGPELTTPFNVISLKRSESLDIKIGADKIGDFGWRDRLGLDSCVNCGRCQDVCPAYAAGRDLSPTELVQELRGAMSEVFKSMLLRREEVNLLDGKVGDDTVWSCITDGACIWACPVDINITDFIVDFRRRLLSENRLDEKKTLLLVNIIDHSNPYGFHPSTRGDWTRGVEVEALESRGDVEYLYWVGCVSSYDTRAQETAKSMVKILKSSGLSFGVLGNEERCCGETLRRVGEEGRFQEVALENIKMFKKYGVKKIVTHCPHCYNTFKNEYPRFGSDFEAIHHSQLLSTLIKKGSLKVTRKMRETVVLHDPCYLGRYNGIYEAPRSALSSIPDIRQKEMERNRERSFCCGGGGGNLWYEVPERERVNSIRMKDFEETGADLLATACPYCLLMFEDALKREDSSREVKVKDIAELLDG